ncbi:MAG TPA: hypothetical protein VMF30_10020, partial [Pirellulales bacterium]|nr:hypothetical protein [Pirellulales bacterium]
APKMPNIPSQARDAFQATLDPLGNRSLTLDDVDELLAVSDRVAWGVSELSTRQLANRLVKAKLLSELRLEFPNRNVVRYVHGSPSAYEVAQSINRAGYLSHFTAIHLHQLTDQIPKVVYLNVEQQMSAGGGELRQDAIDRTFKRPCRVSHNAATFDGLRIVVLNGGNTGCLGVQSLTANNGVALRVTGIERTLIDAVVRPIYSGGVFQVAGAYRAARGRVSAEALVQMLRTLNYTYPYHQAIGFFLERADFPAADVELLRAFPMEFDFYLDYAMRQTEYNGRWRLYVPKGF